MKPNKKQVQISPEEKLMIVALSRVKGLGIRTFIDLLEHYRSVAAIIDSDTTRAARACRS